MSVSVFIDGGHGTTGLEIRERLAGRPDIALIELDEAQRRDEAARRDALNAAGFAILCLPDDASREAVRLAEGSAVRIIDASTAHRVDSAWVYGFPELDAAQPGRIASATRVANPGCYAQTVVALLRPLVTAGLVPASHPVTVNATSGYSGGGKAMIAEFEGGAAPTAFRNYALDLAHKHLPEMRLHAGLEHPPLFSPSVANVARGMIVEIPLAGIADEAAIRRAYESAYADTPLVRLLSRDETERLDCVTIERCAHTDRMEIALFSNPASGQIRLAGMLDNLGKGAAGAAVQNLNLMAGLDPLAGLMR